MTITDKIARIIRSCRLSHGYSQEYMADMLEISQSAYAHLESGKAGITVDRLIRITEILEIDIHQLFDTNAFEKVNEQHSSMSETVTTNPPAKEVYDQLIHELKEEIQFLRSLVKQK